METHYNIQGPIHVPCREWMDQTYAGYLSDYHTRIGSYIYRN